MMLNVGLGAQCVDRRLTCTCGIRSRNAVICHKLSRTRCDNTVTFFESLHNPCHEFQNADEPITEWIHIVPQVIKLVFLFVQTYQ